MKTVFKKILCIIIMDHKLLLWSSGAIPNYQDSGETESTEITDCIRISLVQEPDIAVYLPPKRCATGEAFLLSGRNLDEISNTNIRLIIVTGNELANAGLAVLTDYINSIFEHMTPKQAEIISGLLAGNTQQSIAQQLSKSKSTVHQLTVSGRWQEIEKLLQRFENLINYLL